jgi:hypothetical protein
MNVHETDHGSLRIENDVNSTVSSLRERRATAQSAARATGSSRRSPSAALHPLGRIEHLDGQQVARLVVVEDHAGLVLIALGPPRPREA